MNEEEIERQLQKLQKEKDSLDENKEVPFMEDYSPDYSPIEEIETTPPAPRGKRKLSNFFIFSYLLG